MTQNASLNLDQDHELYAEEIGTLVFQSALMRFFTSAEPAVVAEFEAYVAEHAEQSDFLDTLCAKYPTFATMLTEEMSFLQAEIKEVTSVLDDVVATPVA
jgi:hypothetical protein